jgi:putative spermidine/putrescine transport system substrate-binding protein/putrescine transport system substrate-binding protein
MHYATANAAAYGLIDPAVRDDRGIYPTPEQKAHLYPNAARSQAYTREMNRTWTRFKTGQ